MADLLLRDTDRQELVAEIAAEVVQRVRDVLQEAQEPRLVDRNRMAELAGIGTATLDNLVANNQVPSVTVGRRRLFEPRKVLDALSQTN